MFILKLKVFFLLYYMSNVLGDRGIDIDLRSFTCDDHPIGNGRCNRPEAKSWIKVNGKEALVPRLGWNIVVINHHTGHIESRVAFDTCRSDSANIAMSVFLKNVKDKRIVLGVAHDDAGYKFNKIGIEALNSIAGNGFRREFRGSTAFIGYKDKHGDPFSLREKVMKLRKKGPAYLRTTIAKLVDGVPDNEVMHFNLQSTGFIDRGPLSLVEIAGKTWISYRKDRLVGKLGMNFMIIDHGTGAVHAKINFNTHSLRSQSHAAWKFLDRLPQNMIVLGVVHSDWTLNRNSELEKILRRMVHSRIQLTYDSSWAFIGHSSKKLPTQDFTVSRLSYPRDPVALRSTLPVKIHYFTKRFDVDECKTGTARCGKNTICRNYPGSYMCECKDGYKKSGKDCIDIDECKDGTAICDSKATCTNSPGYYTCSCTATKSRLAMGYRCVDLSIKIESTACYLDSISQRPWCDRKPTKMLINRYDVLQRTIRGFIVFVLGGVSGSIEEMKTFETWKNGGESARMAKYLNSLAENKIVVGSVQDDAAQHIGNDVVLAIKRLTGIEPKFHGLKGAFAFIGYSGPGLPSWVTAKSSEFMKGTTIAKTRFWLMPKPPFVPVKLVSVGYDKGNAKPPSLRFMSVDYAKYLKPGFNIAVLNEWTGSVEQIGQFNTHDKNGPDIRKMEQFLNNLPVDRIVVGVVKGEAYKGIRQNRNLQKAMERILGSPMALKSMGSSYAFIGTTYVGKKERPAYIQQVAQEAGKGQATLSPMISPSRKSTGIKIKLISTGCDTAGTGRHKSTQCQNAKSSINVGGKELSLNKFGLNVAVINRINGHVLHRRRFDTETSKSECIKLAQLINSVPRTSVILGVVKGQAGGCFRIDKDLRIAMKSILGKDAEHIKRGGSYAFIGFKEKFKHSLVKQKYTNTNKLSTEISKTIPIQPEIRIELVSTTCSDPGAGPCRLNKNVIKVNGKDYSKNGRGFNVVTVDIETGDVEERRNFDTWDKNKQDSKKMELFLKKLPAKKIVLGVVKDDAYTSLKQGAKNAIAAILHKKSIAFNGFRHSYAFVGYTSLEPFKWIQDKQTLKYKGPVKLTFGIPIPQYGCVFPKTPLNGKVKRNEYDISQTVDYECEKGLVPSGKSQTCGNHGKWVGSVPRCLKLTEKKAGTSGGKAGTSGGKAGTSGGKAGTSGGKAEISGGKAGKSGEEAKDFDGEIFYSDAAQVNSFHATFLLVFPLLLSIWSLLHHL